MKNQSNFKKSVLSIVILSAVTASFISWDKYQPRHETKTMVEFYQNRDFNKTEVLLQSVATDDSEALARIAEQNLMDQVEFASEEQYSPEADEAINLMPTGEVSELVMWDETVEKKSTMPLEETTIANTLLFSFDSSEISPQYYVSLNKTAQLMQSDTVNQDSVWQVVGYADRSGNYIYNSKLARKRAQAVAEYLVNKGVNEDQLAIISLGTTNPPNDERSIANNRNERRVEIHAYQAEVIALLEQYNVQLKQFEQPATKGPKEPIVETNTAEVKKPITPLPAINFEKVKLKSLTTAMEL